MKHPDHFEIGEQVIGPLNLLGTVAERSPGYCRIHFSAAGVWQWLPIGLFTRPKH